MEPGAVEDLKLDHFVTLYGYGGNQPGRPLKGNAVFPPDDLLRIRTNLPAVEADSGAPILGHDGRAVGILIAGNQSESAFFPLRQLQSLLADYSIFIPPPRDLVVKQDQGIAHPSSPVDNLKGTVQISLGRPKNGKWPTPPVRPAGQGEARVIVTHQYGTLAQTLSTDTGENGSWWFALPVDAGSPAGRYAAVATATIDLDKPIDTREYLNDPVYPVSLDAPIILDIYARSVYVRNQLALGSSEAQILLSGTIWRNCSPLLQVPTQEAPNCSRVNPDMFAELQSQLADIDSHYSKAFGASAADPEDIAITTSIAATLASFRITSNRPCSAASAMQALFDKFSNAYLTAPLVLQTIDMIVACQQLGDSTPVGLMAWRQPNETRQVASVRLIDDTLEHFLTNVSLTRDQRRRIVRDISSAFENYNNNPGVIALSVSAKVIVEDDALYALFKSFISRNASHWCGDSVQVPKRDEASTTRALKGLEKAAVICG